MKRAAVASILALIEASACGSNDERTSSSSTGDSIEASSESTEPTAPKPPPAKKKLRGAWGTIEVDGAFRPGNSFIPLPAGMTADVEYVRYSDGGTALARLVILHQDVPGLAATPDPRLEHSAGDLLAAVVCPGGSMDVGEILIANNERARIQCTRSSLGPGVVASARKGTRAYEVICIEETDPVRCIEYINTFAPAPPPKP